MTHEEFFSRLGGSPGKEPSPADDGGFVESAADTTTPSPHAIEADAWCQTRAEKLVETQDAFFEALAPAMNEKAAVTDVSHIPRRGAPSWKLFPESAAKAKLAVTDFFAAAYELEPALTARCSDKRRHDFCRNLLQGEDFRSLHADTALDEACSQLAALAFARQYAAMIKKDNDPKEQARDAKDASGQRPEARAAAAGMKAAADAKDDVSEMNTALAGLGEGAPGRRRDPNAVLAAWERIKNNRRLKKITQFAGRLLPLTQQLQHQKAAHGADDTTGVVFGDKVERLVPFELAMLGDRDLGDDALRRLNEKQSMVYEIVGLESKQRGPVVVTVDQCLHPNTLIHMADGTFRPIKNVRAGDHVLSFDFDKSRTVAQEVGRVSITHSPETVYEVETPDGVITCSGEHRFFTVRNNAIVEREAKNLKAGDRVASPRWARPITPTATPNDTDTAWAQACGYLLGDGHKWHDKKRDSRSITMTDETTQHLHLYASIFEALGYNPLIRHRGGRNRLCVNSAALYRKLEQEMPLLLVKQPRRDIPDAVLSWDDIRLAAFLRGLWDAEGNVGDHQLRMTMSSAPVMAKVQLALKRFGIITEFSKVASGYSDGSYDTVTISDRKSLDLFADKIGFGSTRKASALRAIIGHPRMPHRGRFSAVPVDLNQYLDTARASGLRGQRAPNPGNRPDIRSRKFVGHHVGAALKHTRRILTATLATNAAVKLFGLSTSQIVVGAGLTEKQVKRIYNGQSLQQRHRDAIMALAKQRASDTQKATAEIRKIIRGGVFWTKVNSVRQVASDTEVLHDLTMNGPHHNYLAGNVVVHNSGSMDNDKGYMAMAVALNMAWVAKHQRRWVALVAFSGGKKGDACVFLPEEWGTPEAQTRLLAWMSGWLGGGTTLDVPLVDLPFHIWPEIRPPEGKTDIVMVTDDEVNAPQKVIDDFNAWRKEKLARVYGIRIDHSPGAGGGSGDIAKVSDVVYVTAALGPDDEATRAVLSL